MSSLGWVSLLRDIILLAMITQWWWQAEVMTKGRETGKVSFERTCFSQLCSLWYLVCSLVTMRWGWCCDDRKYDPANTSWQLQESPRYPVNDTTWLMKVESFLGLVPRKRVHGTLVTSFSRHVYVTAVKSFQESYFFTNPWKRRHETKGSWVMNRGGTWSKTENKVFLSSCLTKSVTKLRFWNYCKRPKNEKGIACEREQCVTKHDTN